MNQLYKGRALNPGRSGLTSQVYCSRLRAQLNADIQKQPRPQTRSKKPEEVVFFFLLRIPSVLSFSLTEQFSEPRAQTSEDGDTTLKARSPPGL